eukprot:g2669.t1
MCIGACLRRLFGRKKVKNEEDDVDDELSKSLRDVEEGNDGDWGDWEGSGNWEENQTSTSKQTRVSNQQMSSNSKPVRKPVRRRSKKPDYFGELGMVPTIKKPMTKKVVKSQSLRPGMNSRFAVDEKSAQDAISGWDVDAVSEESGWMQDGVFDDE